MNINIKNKIIHEIILNINLCRLMQTHNNQKTIKFTDTMPRVSLWGKNVTKKQKKRT